MAGVHVCVYAGMCAVQCVCSGEAGVWGRGEVGGSEGWGRHVCMCGEAKAGVCRKRRHAMQAEREQVVWEGWGRGGGVKAGVCGGGVAGSPPPPPILPLPLHHHLPDHTTPTHLPSSILHLKNRIDREMRDACHCQPPVSPSPLAPASLPCRHNTMSRFTFLFCFCFFLFHSLSLLKEGWLAYIIHIDRSIVLDIFFSFPLHLLFFLHMQRNMHVHV